MREDVYFSLAQVEKKHWWFRARREIILGVLNRLYAKESRPEEILDVGAGTGYLSESLTAFGKVSALEQSPQALAFLKQKANLTVVSGILPNSNLNKESFDLVTAFDVLEHIEDDRGALTEICSALKEDGYFLMTVPAHKSFWSDHDVIHHHFRRYNPRQLESLIKEHGFEIIYSTPFQTMLFPVFVLDRFLRNFFKFPHIDRPPQLPPRWLNWIAYKIFSVEKLWTSNGLRSPIGSSHLVLARKNFSNAKKKTAN